MPAHATKQNAGLEHAKLRKRFAKGLATANQVSQAKADACRNHSHVATRATTTTETMLVSKIVWKDGKSKANCPYCDKTNETERVGKVRCKRPSCAKMFIAEY